MDLQNPIVLRGLERICIVIGGMVFGFLGYKLFIFGSDRAEAKLSAESQVYKIVFSGTGPGLFFMAFGAIILVMALFTGGAKRYPVNPSAESNKSIVMEELQINKKCLNNIKLDEQ